MTDLTGYVAQKRIDLQAVTMPDLIIEYQLSHLQESGSARFFGRAFDDLLDLDSSGLRHATHKTLTRLSRV
jgi:hypothetical protein